MMVFFFFRISSPSNMQIIREKVTNSLFHISKEIFLGPIAKQISERKGIASERIIR